MAVDKKKQKETKELVNKLLSLDGIEYDTWLNEKHNEIIIEKSNFITRLLDSKND